MRFDHGEGEWGIENQGFNLWGWPLSRDEFTRITGRGGRGGTRPSKGPEKGGRSLDFRSIFMVSLVSVRTDFPGLLGAGKLPLPGSLLGEGSPWRSDRG